MLFGLSGKIRNQEHHLRRNGDLRGMHTPAFTLGTSGFRPVSAAGELGGGRQASAELRIEFEKIVLHGLPRFRRMAMRWLRNPEDAEDAVQDAMLSAFKHIAAFDGRAQLSTWVMAIVINAVRMKLRSRPRCHIVSLDQMREDGQWAISELIADLRPTPEQTLEQCELRELVTKLTGSLPLSQRTALRLRQRDGLSIRMAAEALGVPEGTLKAQIARGRAKLIQRFHEAAGRRRTKAAIPDATANRGPMAR
jgi:RNA polymerase sigma-70 factor (ECF subfamily)